MFVVLPAYGGSLPWKVWVNVNMHFPLGLPINRCPSHNQLPQAILLLHSKRMIAIQNVLSGWDQLSCCPISLIAFTFLSKKIRFGFPKLLNLL